MHAIAHDFGWRPRLRAMARGRHGHGHGPFGGFGEDIGFGPGPGFGPPWGPFGPGGPGGRGRRASRGDVRAAVLLLLEEEPRNGYALMQELERRSEGAWRPSPGSIYPALAQLEDEGLIRATVPAQPGSSGRVFELTDVGSAHVDERREELGEPWLRVGPRVPGEMRELGKLVSGVAKAAVEVLRSGSDEQRRRAVELLGETRRSLYRILADEPGE